ncbi:MAG: hypothetical protein U0V74_09555 [Chitinophagales bacterium]
MRNKAALFFAFLLYTGSITAQTPYSAVVADSVPSTYLKLRLSNDSIQNNDLLNEQLVDLVEVDERDPKVPTWYTTHQGGGFGWFIRMIGFWWQAVDRHRYKFVGTTKHGVSLPDRDELTEHDINWNITPHQQKYLDLIYKGRAAQVKHKRNFKRARYADVTKAPYIEPTIESADEYDLHCELTPPKRLRDSLSFLFYPCKPGPNLDQHPNFCDAHPSVGMYGVFVLDCNHSCHPEIHPYEWLWWLDLNSTGGTIPPRTWNFGFMKESSDRFVLWSRPPRVGSISIPFIFKTCERNSSINVTHLVKGKFKPLGLKKLKSLPKQTGTFNFTDSLVQVQMPDGKEFPLRLTSNQSLHTPALRWWFGSLNTDKSGEWIWGTINIAVSIRNAYAAKVETITR